MSEDNIEFVVECNTFRLRPLLCQTASLVVHKLLLYGD